MTIAVQINGKVKGTIDITKETTQEQAMEKVHADPKIASFLTSEPKKIIFVPGKIINIIV